MYYIYYIVFVFVKEDHIKAKLLLALYVSLNLYTSIYVLMDILKIPSLTQGSMFFVFMFTIIIIQFGFNVNNWGQKAVDYYFDRRSNLKAVDTFISIAFFILTIIFVVEQYEIRDAIDIALNISR